MDIPIKLNQTLRQQSRIINSEGKYTSQNITAYNGGEVHVSVCLRCGAVVGDAAEEIHDKWHEE